jgi:nucleoside-diphosphate-sugar epimerase
VPHASSRATSALAGGGNGAVRGTVLITGGNGFLGAHLASHIGLHGYRVCSYDLHGPEPAAAFVQADAAASITHVVGDVTDLAALTRVIREHDVSHIVHAAAASDPVDSIAHPYRTYALNAMGTAAVLEAAWTVGGVGRVIVISSNAVYGANRYEPIDEGHPTISLDVGNLHAHYGASKIVSEVMALTYHTANDVDTLVLRLSAVYGFGMRGSLYIRPMVEQAVAGLPSRFPAGGDMRRDYTYVDDAARGVLAALEVDAAGLPQRVFNISGGHAYKASELPSVIRAVIPEADVEIGPGLNPAEVRDASTRGTLDLGAALTCLEYAPAWTLRQGVEDYVQVLRRFLESAGDDVSLGSRSA